MNGEDFLKAAYSLCDGDHEAHWRSAVSRAYYALYHVSAEALAPILKLTGRGSDHRLVADCLRNVDEANLDQAADRVNQLLDARIDADYRLKLTVNRADTELRSKAAARAIQLIKRSDLGQGRTAQAKAALDQYLASQGRQQHIRP